MKWTKVNPVPLLFPPIKSSPIQLAFAWGVCVGGWGVREGVSNVPWNYMNPRHLNAVENKTKTISIRGKLCKKKVDVNQLNIVVTLTPCTLWIEWVWDIRLLHNAHTIDFLGTKETRPDDLVEVSCAWCGTVTLYLRLSSFPPYAYIPNAFANGLEIQWNPWLNTAACELCVSFALPRSESCPTYVQN